MTPPRWNPESHERATREQVKNEWRIYYLELMQDRIALALEEPMHLRDTALNEIAEEMAEEIVAIMAEAIERATGQKLP